MATASGDGAELPDDAGCRVYVGNLTPKAGEAHLQAQFARFGVIHSIWVARKPPGFAFVVFAKPAQARRAVDCCEGGVEILGKTARVQMAGDKQKKPATSSGSDNGRSRSQSKSEAIKKRSEPEPQSTQAQERAWTTEAESEPESTAGSPSPSTTQSQSQSQPQQTWLQP